MTVNPGWGGQPFIQESPAKVARLRELAGEAAIEVDGGIDPSTAGSVSEAGAGLLVAGSAIFGLTGIAFGHDLTNSVFVGALLAIALSAIRSEQSAAAAGA